jgi:hypothetical protein
MFIDFCEKNGFVITITRFQKSKRRLYTWKAPRDQKCHELDYILMNYPFRNSRTMSRHCLE